MKFPPGALRDFEALCLNDQVLTALMRLLASGEGLFTWSDVEASLRRETGSDETSEVVSGIRNLLRLKNALGMDPQSLVGFIQENLENDHADWYERHRERWRIAKDLIAATLGSPAVFRISKTAELAQLKEKVFASCRVVTDLRPVFDDDRSKILQGVLVHNLIIDYYEGSEQRELHVALDAADIRALREVCESAEKKAKLIIDDLSRLNWAIVIEGEPTSRSSDGSPT